MSAALRSLATLYSYELQLNSGILLKRYKRFLADVDMGNGISTVYCPNTGSLLGMNPSAEHQPRCACSVAPFTSKRKYTHTLEMIEDRGVWVGIHSALANKIVRRALSGGDIIEFRDIMSIEQEVKVEGKSRIDFLLTLPSTSESASVRKCFIEVKSVSMAVERVATGTSYLRAEFPDCESERAQKHIRFLTDHVLKGGDAAVIFLIQRPDCSAFSISKLDMKYERLVSLACEAGVKILPYHVELDAVGGEIRILGRLPFIDTYKEQDSNATTTGHDATNPSTSKSDSSTASATSSELRKRPSKPTAQEQVKKSPRKK